MIVNELFGFSGRNKDKSGYTNNPYAVMSNPPAAKEPAEEPTIDEPTVDEPAAAPSSMGNMARQLAARGHAQTSTGGATIATGTGVRHAASPLNPNQPVYPSATPQAAAKLAASPATPQAAAGNPAAYSAANVMKMPGMEKYAKPAASATTPNFASPSGYGKVTTSFKPAAPKQPITIDGQKIPPTNPAYNKIMGAYSKIMQKPTVESLTWSKDFDPGMTLLRKMRK